MRGILIPIMRLPRQTAVVLSALGLTGCAGLNYVDIESTNQNSRINLLVIHATSENFAESLRLLSTRHTNPVSAHYLVPRLGDSTYEDDDLKIYRLVDENRRAWHAGISQWDDSTDLNNQSIGIEIVNEFKCNELEVDETITRVSELECTFPPYPDSQVEMLIALIDEILERNPEIDPEDIVGHADIAPDRKSDPGPEFPWKELYDRGIGAWYDADTADSYLKEFTGRLPSTPEWQCALSTYGYPIEITGEHDLQSQFALRAFQLHYRPSDYSGNFDTETAAILYALNDKYRNGNRHDCAMAGEE